ncbi:hypothetical protein Clacol_003996 [Clathrus columnatus]|uniref:PLC-like phosphodiesterase n=1 Tax=Clathrus columnatus TaxID=1419009 RepID=A0AAV5A7Z3_9AGAM|nr:hypothetical protein Clacol_003996 [Clathrus columnatus]
MVSLKSLCDRSYGNITSVGTHDAYAIGTDVGSNQDQSTREKNLMSLAVTTQLNDGVRLIQLQALQQSSGIEACHTSCLIKDGGSVASILTEIKTWLDENPNNVVSLLIANVDNIPVASWKLLYEDVGVDKISYSPPTAAVDVTQWPTLREMIANGTKLVTFLDNQADFTQAPYIIDEFQTMWESPFDVTSPDSFQCAVNRTHGTPANQIFTINHFLDQETNILGAQFPIPNRGALNTTNGVSGPGSLGAEVQTCIATQGRPPTFMLVDFYEVGGGSVFQVAAAANGLPFTPQPIAQSTLSGNGSSGGSSNGGVTTTPLNSASALFNTPRLATKVVIACSILFGVLTTL